MKESQQDNNYKIRSLNNHSEILYNISDFGLSEFKEDNNQNILSRNPLYMDQNIFESNVGINTIEINPYLVLKISSSADATKCKNAFKNLVISSNKDIKSKACLPYEVLCNKQNFV